MLKDPLDKGPATGIVVPIVDHGLGNSAFVVDLGDGGALVVDPERDPRPYLDEIKARGLKPKFVIETHLHADFVSGALELKAIGADLAAPAGSRLTYPHRALHDDEEVDLGGLTLRVIATPGHTPEHLAYLLLDGSEPLALFTGGTLTAGGAARTDLLSPDQTESLARATYRSIYNRLFRLPDDLAVYPTHGGGSFCSVGSGTERTTSIGQERTSNPLLADNPDEDTFVKRLLSGYGSFPPYFLELREVNRRGVETFGPTPPSLDKLSVADVEKVVEGGGVVVDVRKIRAFGDGHVPGAISNPWRSQFATWLGWLVQQNTPLVFVADEKVDRRDLVWAVLTVGFENLVGELDGGMEAWKEAGRPVERIQVTDAALDGVHVVDVRQSSEYLAGHFPEAIHLELGALTESTDQIPDGPMLVHCGHGERAMTAASLLIRAGHRDVAVLEGPPHRLGPIVTSST
jgi:hydroxyacylglutathione hydrolase